MHKSRRAGDSQPTLIPRNSNFLHGVNLDTETSVSCDRKKESVPFTNMIHNTRPVIYTR